MKINAIVIDNYDYYDDDNDDDDENEDDNNALKCICRVLFKPKSTRVYEYYSARIKSTDKMRVSVLCQL